MPADTAPASVRAKAVRVPFPLPAKIAVCFLLNLILLAGVAVYVARGQFRFGLDSLLTGSSGQRVQGMATLIVSELHASKRAEWSAILKRHAEANHIQIAAMQNDGVRIAGTITDPPLAVLKKLAEGSVDPRPRPQPPRPPREEGRGDFPPGGPRGAPPRGDDLRDFPSGDPQRRLQPRSEEGGDFPPRRDFSDGRSPRADAPPPRSEDGPPFREGRENRPPLQDGMPRDGHSVLPGGGPSGYRKFITRAGEPPMYWIGIRTPLLEDDGRFGPPSTLLLALPRLGAGGLLFDVTPWLWTGAGVLACSVLLWLPLMRGITRSVRQMTGAAGHMAQGQFGVRVGTRRRDELGQLGESLNHMAGRLGEYVTGQKRFLGDIAHELCSPLARMEMALGVLEQQANEKQQGYVTDVREEVRQMSSLVNELLSFSKAGLRAKDIELRPVPLAELCEKAVAREAQGKTDIAVKVDAALKVLADPDLLARAIGNILRNAVRYAGDAGPIVLGATVRGADVILAITDSGPGVEPETLHRLFDPFYRPETARTREGGGAGLGLAIVKSCIEACGGTVAVKNARPGLEVTMTLRHAE